MKSLFRPLIYLACLLLSTLVGQSAVAAEVSVGEAVTLESDLQVDQTPRLAETTPCFWG